MNQTLWRDFALGFLIRPACMVSNHQSLAAKQGRPNRLKMVEVELPSADSFDSNAPLNFFDGIIGRPEQARQPDEQWLDLWAEQAACVKIRQQMLHGQQGMDFLGGEPESW